MRVIVTGATGNVGTAELEQVTGHREVTSVAGLARRKPQSAEDGVEWVQADVRSADLVDLFRGADVVVDLARPPWWRHTAAGGGCRRRGPPSRTDLRDRWS